MANVPLDEAVELKIDQIINTANSPHGSKENLDIGLLKKVVEEISYYNAEDIIIKAGIDSACRGTLPSEEVTLIINDLTKGVNSTEIDPQHTEVAEESTATKDKNKGNSIPKK